MKTYDKLKKKERDKLNTILLYALHYTFLDIGILLCIYMLGVLAILIVVLGDIFVNAHLVFYSLLLLALMLLLWVIMRVVGRKNKKKFKRYFGVEKIERDIFRDKGVK